MQSAGIPAVSPLPPGSTNTVERIVDIRVDDHEEPFKELRRLLYMTTGVPNRLSERAATLVAEGNFSAAIATLQQALAINPRSEQLQYALAQRYAQAGDVSNAMKWLETTIKRQPRQWKPRAAADPLFVKLRDRTDFKRLVTP